MKHPKMDPLLLSGETHELDDLVNKMKKEGIKTGRKELRRLKDQYNHSRADVINHLRQHQGGQKDNGLPEGQTEEQNNEHTDKAEG